MPNLRQRPHTIRRFAAWVLACFVLSLGVAVASPVVHPQGTVLLCTGAGVMKLLVQSDDGVGPSALTATMDCPLCVPAAGPLPQPVPAPQARVVPAGYVVPVIVLAPTAVRSAAPLPARGPPIL